MTDEQTYDAGDEAAVKRSRLNKQQRAERDANDLRAVLSTPSGRRVLGRILDWCGLDAITVSPADPAAHAKLLHHDGRRSIGHAIRTEISATDEGAYLKFLTALEIDRA